jgi:hypothetical protein
MLVRNTFNTAVTDARRLAAQFALTANVVAKVPVRVISYPRTLRLIQTVREAILTDLRIHSSKGTDDG